MKYTRNEFLKLTGIGISGAATVPATSIINFPSVNNVKLNFGLASYTFGSFSRGDTIKMALRPDRPVIYPD